MTDVHDGFLVDEDAMRLMMLSDTPRFIAVGIGYPGTSSIMQSDLAANVFMGVGGLEEAGPGANSRGLQ